MSFPDLSLKTRRHAIRKLAARDASRGLTLTCIDPAPPREIEEVPDVVIRRSVLGSDAITLATSLDEKDVLFIDGAHSVFNGTDAPFLFLHVLPRGKPGVVIHVRDIMLSCEYDAVFSEGEPSLPVYWLSRKGRATHGTSCWMRRGAGCN